MGRLCVCMGIQRIPLASTYKAPFRNVLITPQMARFNERMSEVRVAVEWMFGCVSNYYKFIDFQKQLQIGLSPAGILQNAHMEILFQIILVLTPQIL